MMGVSSQLHIVMGLPDRDFDITESAIPWQRFVQAGIQVTFATERGGVALCDTRQLRSGFFNPFPAKPDACAAYRQMTDSPSYRHPIRFDDIDTETLNAVHLPGGHAPGMCRYLENKVLQQKVAEIKRTGKLIGALCHGVLIPARAIDPVTSRSVLDGYTVTTLTKSLEMSAFAFTFLRVGRRFRTYRAYTEDEVREAVGVRGSIQRGNSIGEPFIVTDRELITARYRVDAERYAQAVIARLRVMQASANSTGAQGKQPQP